jgi:hypothetical protein
MYDDEMVFISEVDSKLFELLQERAKINKTTILDVLNAILKRTFRDGGAL